LLLGACAWVLAACVPPPGPLERLTDAAYDLNTAMRFGRMDVAMDYVDPAVRLEFAKRHSSWGEKVRVLDVDLASIQPMAEDTVDVKVLVAWHRTDEMTMRRSLVAQRWKITDDDWRLVEERRIGGDPGLFVPVRKKKKQPSSKEAGGATAVAEAAG
jgi:hypothetical protein